ncbi:MAG: hypothetical protein QOE18_554, partial [Chloroflexota bacterium]|nr:hypothetical protein [Chloroflexota bacterium]
DNAKGGYRFIAAPGRPFSGGMVAVPGFDLVHATFQRPLPLAEGLEAARRHVAQASRPVQAIAGFELRIAAPYKPDGFEVFNHAYVESLTHMGLVVDGLMPAARTNVAAVVGGVSEPRLYAFTYTVPGNPGGPAFLMSGVPEEEPGDLESMLDSMMRMLSSRMAELGVTWQGATAIQLYGVEVVQGLLADYVLKHLGPAAVHGIHWFPSLPPIEDLRLEIDVRSAGTELLLPA